MTDNVIPFPPSSQGGVSVVPPRSVQFCADNLPAGGFDTVRIKILWPFQLPRSGGFIGVDADGVIGERLMTKFTKMRLESWRGGWAYKPEIEGDNHYLTLEGSPAKAGTGQNLYLPEGEGLGKGIMLGLEPFLLELRDLCRIDLGYEQLRLEVYKAVLCASVQRIDFTSHYDLGDFTRAESLIRVCDVQGGGIYYKGQSKLRWRRQSDTSLVAGTGRRWGAKLYIKQNEMVVNGHCPSLDRFNLYEDAAGWVRYEYTIRGELLLPEEKSVIHWTAERLRDFRRKTVTKVYWPGQRYQSQKRFTRSRHEHDRTPAIVARKVRETIAYLDQAGIKEFDSTIIDAIVKSMYREKRFEYRIDDAFCQPDVETKMRKRDFEILRNWHDGIDVWDRLNPVTAKRIRNNIFKHAGIDIRQRKEMDLPTFEVGPVITPARYMRDWKDLLAA